MPEEWREWRAIQSGAATAAPYDDQPWQRTEMFIRFAGLEHEAARRAAARERSRR